LKTEQSKRRWLAIRSLVERYCVPYEALAEACNLSADNLRKIAHTESWKLSDKAQLLSRLHSLLTTQIEELEASASNGESLDEKSARTLGTLARTWEKLTELEIAMEDARKDKSNTKQVASSDEQKFAGHEDIHSFRAELERRIRVLVEQKETSEVSTEPKPD